MGSNSNGGWCGGCLVILVIIAIVAFVGVIPERISTDHIQGVVVDKYVMPGVYYVVVKKVDGVTEVFQVRDAMFWWHWDSADKYAEIQLGESYHFFVAEWRFRPFSWFRNILWKE